MALPDRFAALSAEEIASQLSGPPEVRAAFLHSLAEAGVADAQALYGQLLLDGAGVAQDAPAASSAMTSIRARRRPGWRPNAAAAPPAPMPCSRGWG